MSKRKSKEGPPPASSRTKPDSPSSSTEGAFDLWLQRGLHRLYDEVAQEPVPEDLLRLIEEDRKK